METAKREKLKLYGVLVLVVVFVAMGYFRFFYTPKKPAPTAAASPSEMQLALTEFTDPRPSLGGITADPVTARRSRIIRDIFSSGEFVHADKTTEEKQAPPVPPTFSLKGTIVAGRHPIAVINNRFVRAGDHIEGYRVMKIDKKNVWLESGSHRVKVETLPYE
jgi:hypothetical protein